MNSSKKPDSVYCGAEKELKKPSPLLILGCARISRLRRFDVWARKFISINYWRNKTTIYGPDTHVSYCDKIMTKGSRVSTIFSRGFYSIKSDLDSFQQTAPFWLHISL